MFETRILLASESMRRTTAEHRSQKKKRTTSIKDRPKSFDRRQAPSSNPLMLTSVFSFFYLYTNY
jgi:hypothetical protein